MTTSRVIRGTRAKIFLYVCAILIITGIIACYNNTLSQLDDVRKSNEICHQQEENLSTQLQVISDYKQRLEKSLKTEKAEHQQTKTNLENKLNEERNKNDKSSSDAKLKLNSLQQHFNLLQTQHEDFKEECTKTQQKQLEDINDLQLKLKEIKEELKKVEASKEHLKTQYVELQIEKQNVEKQLNENQVNKNENESNVNHLIKENNELKRDINNLKEKCPLYDTLQEPKQEVSSPKNFNGMVVSKTDSSLYQIPNAEGKPSDANVLNMPPVDKQEKSVLAVPNSNDFVSPVSKSTTRSGLKPSQGSLNAARPLLRPTVTPETLIKNNYNQALPEGVVPDPDKKEDNGQNEQPEIVNNRYQNVKESANEVAVEKTGKEDIDKENGAHEVFDAPLGQNGLEGLAFGDNDHVKNVEKQHFEKNHIDALGVGDKERKIYDQDQPDYKDLQNDVQLEENEEDDDDEYADRMGRHKEPAVRN
ncbi:putative leucine-rich repeat-containing protein DDB_G0290503 [Anoplophora glabripennis]|nr:putative leucine-rich repeat-containing protein DDB_G0290503 [Anoplophora glabripennis]